MPLNYSDPQGAEAIIALIRKPSPLAESSPEYRGPILFNPGGPGGSGVEFINTVGDVMSSIIGPQFDIVSFDPRGMCVTQVQSFSSWMTQTYYFFSQVSGNQHLA